MTTQHERTMTARCVCGAVEIEAWGEPLSHLSCYCDDCQEAGRQLEAMPGAPRVKDDDGGTRLVLYRRDRYRVVRGEDRLLQHKLRAPSATHRVYTSCCHSALHLGFERGPHWVSFFTTRVEGEPPPLEVLVQTKFKPAGVPFAHEAPASSFPIGLVLRLLWSRVLMALGR